MDGINGITGLYHLFSSDQYWPLIKYFPIFEVEMIQ